MNRQAAHLSPQTAFTLIELLVVVTIIVVLLALLSPALDQAVYQAELAVCATHQRAAGGGLVVYAADHRRHYPYRKGVREAADWETARLSVDGFDDRVPLNGYISLNSVLNDPLNQAVDYVNTRSGSFVYTPYALWFGWRFAGEKGMFKLGDRFTWRGSSFSLLLGDLDMVYDNSSALGAHPDDANLMPRVVLQDEPSPYPFLAPGTNIGNANSVVSWYWLFGSHIRGLVDLNFLTDDGAVVRHSRIAWEETIPPGHDRLTSVPWIMSGSAWPAAHTTVPRQP